MKTEDLNSYLFWLAKSLCGSGKSFLGEKTFILAYCTPPTLAREFGSDDSLEFSLVTDSQKR